MPYMSQISRSYQFAVFHKAVIESAMQSSNDTGIFTRRPVIVIEGIEMVNHLKPFILFGEIIDCCNVHQKIERQFRIVTQELEEFVATGFFHGDSLIIAKVVAVNHYGTELFLDAFNDFVFRHRFAILQYQLDTPFRTRQRNAGPVILFLSLRAPKSYDEPLLYTFLARGSLPIQGAAFPDI